MIGGDDRVDQMIRQTWNDIKDFHESFGAFSNDLADRIERDFNVAADKLRAAAQQAAWLPDGLRPPAPAPPAATTAAGRAASLPVRCFRQLHGWADRHRALSAALLAFVSTGTYLVWRRRRLLRQRRRARRAPSGAKTELVVLAGSPFSAVTRSLALDLERRGFIVQIPVGSPEEEAAVMEYRGADVKPLYFDITSIESTAAMLSKLSAHLANPHRHGTRHLHLASLLLLEPWPSTLPVAPLAALGPEAWADALNAHVLYPISLAHAFLPLLTVAAAIEAPPSEPSSVYRPPSAAAAAPVPPTTIVLLTPAVAPVVHPPGHAPEATVAAALTSYLASLRAELPPALGVAHLRVSAPSPLPPPAGSRLRSNATLVPRRITATASSDASSDASDSPPRPSDAGAGDARPRRGAAKAAKVTKADRAQQRALRRLHEDVFDAVVGRTAGTVFVGRGARVYALLGAWAPAGLVRWMLGAGWWRGTGHRLGGGDVGSGERRVPRGAEASRAASEGGSEGGQIDGGSAEWEKVGGKAEEEGSPVGR